MYGTVFLSNERDFVLEGRSDVTECVSHRESAVSARDRRRARERETLLSIDVRSSMESNFAEIESNCSLDHEEIESKVDIDGTVLRTDKNPYKWIRS